MSSFYVCKFCGKKVARTYLAQHTLGVHFERCYTKVIIGEQTQWNEKAEIYNDNEFEEKEIKKELPEETHLAKKFKSE